jgi:hypothetical protein
LGASFLPSFLPYSPQILGSLGRTDSQLRVYSLPSMTAGPTNRCISPLILLSFIFGRITTKTPAKFLTYILTPRKNRNYQLTPTLLFHNKINTPIVGQ